MQATHHERASEASSSAQAAGQDITSLGSSLRGQASASIKERVKRAQQTRVLSGKKSATEDEEEDDDAMGFSSLSHQGIRRSAASGSSRIPETPLSKKLRSGLGEGTNADPCMDWERGSEADSMAGLFPSLQAEAEQANKSADDNGVEEPQEHVIGRGRSRRGRGRSSANNRASAADAGVASGSGGLIEKAKALLNAKKTQFNDGALWDTKMKSRAVDAMAQQLENMVEKLLACGDDAAAKPTMEVMLDFAESVKMKFKVFADIRKGGSWLQNPMAPHASTTLRGLQPSILATIFTFLARELLKTIEQAGAHVLLFHCVSQLGFRV